MTYPALEWHAMMFARQSNGGSICEIKIRKDLSASLHMFNQLEAYDEYSTNIPFVLLNFENLPFSFDLILYLEIDVWAASSTRFKPHLAFNNAQPRCFNTNANKFFPGFWINKSPQQLKQNGTLKAKPQKSSNVFALAQKQIHNLS